MNLRPFIRKTRKCLSVNCQSIARFIMSPAVYRSAMRSATADSLIPILSMLQTVWCTKIKDRSSRQKSGPGQSDAVLRNRIDRIADRAFIILIIRGDRDRIVPAVQRERDDRRTAAVFDQFGPCDTLIKRIREIFDTAVTI